MGYNLYFFQFWAAYVPCESQYLNAVQLTIEQLDLIRRMVDQYPDYLQLALTAEGGNWEDISGV